MHGAVVLGKMSGAREWVKELGEGVECKCGDRVKKGQEKRVAR